MNAISFPYTSEPGCLNLSSASSSYHALQLSRVTASSKESKDITIFTSEGDKVTLSYDHQTQASYANLKALSFQGNFTAGEDTAIVKEMLTALEGERFWFEDSQDLSISVEGDLNEQELEDIKKAIMKIDKIMTGLLHGDSISEAMSRAENIRNLETISGLEADYQYERSVIIEQISVEEVTRTSDYRPAEGDLQSHNRDEWVSLEGLIDRMAEVMENSKVKPAKFYKPLRKLFSDISHGLGKNRPQNMMKRHLTDWIGAELFKRIRDLAEDQNPASDPSKI